LKKGLIFHVRFSMGASLMSAKRRNSLEQRRVRTVRDGEEEYEQQGAFDGEERIALAFGEP